MTAEQERRLEFSVALHQMVCAGHALVGGDGDAMERARCGVVAVLDALEAEGVPEGEMDAALFRINLRLSQTP